MESKNKDMESKSNDETNLPRIVKNVQVPEDCRNFSLRLIRGKETLILDFVLPPPKNSTSQFFAGNETKQNEIGQAENNLTQPKTAESIEKPVDEQNNEAKLDQILSKPESNEKSSHYTQDKVKNLI